MVAGKHYKGLPADIWSCGVILYAMVCGYLPFEDPKTNVLYKKILNADYTIPEFVSEECRELITQVLNTDPDKRFTLEQIKGHSWYNQIKNAKEYSGIIIGSDPIPVDIQNLQNVMEKLECRDMTLEEARLQIE
jgi:5'-AMP-activated protein kinase catalytic alpha subunit